MAKSYKPTGDNYIDDKYLIHSKDGEHPSVYEKIEDLISSKLYRNPRMLNIGSNYDTLEEGIYTVNTWSGSGTGTNVPANKSIGILISLDTSPNKYQVFFNFSQGKVMSRDLSTAWKTW